MKVNKAQLAEVLGVSEKTLTEWQKEEPPLPVLNAAQRRGQANEYETSAVIEWLVQRRMRSAGVMTPKDRLLLLQGEDLAYRLAEKRKQLIDVAQLEPALRREVVAFKARLEEAADSIDMELGDGRFESSFVTAVREIVDRHIQEALFALSRWKEGGLMDDPSEQDGGTAGTKDTARRSAKRETT